MKNGVKIINPGVLELYQHSDVAPGDSPKVIARRPQRPIVKEHRQARAVAKIFAIRPADYDRKRGI